MNNSICTLFDNILIDIHKFKSLRYLFVKFTHIFITFAAFTNKSTNEKYTINKG